MAGLVQASSLAAPVDAFVTQPDGALISVYQKGNAEQQWIETSSGYTIIKKESGEWVYATRSGANKSLTTGSGLLTTNLIVGLDEPATHGIEKHLTPDYVAPPRHRLFKAVGGNNAINSVTGTIPMVVLLAYYDDALAAANCMSCATTHPDIIQQLFFSTVNTGQTVAHYFTEASKGALNLVPATESHGTADDGVIGWMRLGATTPEATVQSTSSFKSNRIAADAINKAMGYIDFTQFDVNNDGRVTSAELTIVVVLGGYESSFGKDATGKALASDSTSPRLWGQSRSFVSSFSGVSAPIQIKNGSTVVIDTVANGMTYSIVGERHGNHPLTMGIVAHELGHSLFSLPDLYDITAVSYGVGGWSLMGFGSWGKKNTEIYAGATPVMLDAWSRIAMGWIDPDIPENGSVTTINAAHQSNANIIKIPTANGNEYFLVENRQNVGYDQGLSYLILSNNYGGLAVWHIDDSMGTRGLNNDNADVNRKRVDLVAAVGDTLIDSASSYGQAKNLFYEGNVAEVNDSTTPSTRLYGGELSAVDISSISVSDNNMSLFVSYSTNAVISSSESSGNRAAAQNKAAVSASEANGGGGAFGMILLVMLGFMGIRRSN